MDAVVKKNKLETVWCGFCQLGCYWMLCDWEYFSQCSSGPSLSIRSIPQSGYQCFSGFDQQFGGSIKFLEPKVRSCSPHSCSFITVTVHIFFSLSSQSYDSWGQWYTLLPPFTVLLVSLLGWLSTRFWKVAMSICPQEHWWHLKRARRSWDLVGVPIQSIHSIYLHPTLRPHFLGEQYPYDCEDQEWEIIPSQLQSL